MNKVWGRYQVFDHVFFDYLILMHCIVHTYMHRKNKKQKTKKEKKIKNFEKHKNKHVVASLALLRLSLEHIGLSLIHI